MSASKRTAVTASDTSTSVTANSAASSTPIQRRAGRAIDAAVSAAIAPSTSTFVRCSADGSPHTNTQPTQTAIVTASTHLSTVNVIQYGIASGGRRPESM